VLCHPHPSSCPRVGPTSLPLSSHMSTMVCMGSWLSPQLGCMLVGINANRCLSSDHHADAGMSVMTEESFGPVVGMDSSMHVSHEIGRLCLPQAS
jgi:hypothetical protein